MLREMMRYHTQGITDPTTRVQQARAFLDFVTHSAIPQDGPYARYLREESEKFEKFPDTYIFHDHLADQNQPVYFHEFVAHAVSSGLRYLSHAAFSIEEARLSPDVPAGHQPDRVRRCTPRAVLSTLS